MLSRFQDLTQQENKGLFTFYREQSERQQQIKQLKKLRRQARIKLQYQTKIKQEEELINDKMNTFKSRQLSQIDTGRSYKSINQPKSRRQKYTKHQLGTSVIIVNSNENQHKEYGKKSLEQRANLKRIQQMINPYNNNRYFLQNKQLPIAFGKVSSLQKQIVKKDQQQNKQKQKNAKAIKQSYFNSYNDIENQQKYIPLPSLSYEKLPELSIKKPSHSQMIIPKRYKSKKIQAALRSNNSDLIKQIRQSLKQQSSCLQRVSYIDANSGIQRNLYERQYQKRLNSKLDAKQKRLIQIIRNSTNIQKNRNL